MMRNYDERCIVNDERAPERMPDFTAIWDGVDLLGIGGTYSTLGSAILSALNDIAFERKLEVESQVVM